MEINNNFLKENAKKINIDLSDEQIQKFNIYAQYLKEVNEYMNLTAITEYDKICMLHFIDSLYLMKCVNLFDNSSLIDVGTGAGFPSFPCKIFNDKLNITTIDSLNKRVNFLNELSQLLKINVQSIHGRAEELGNNSIYREKFDFATARAVAKLRDLTEYCLPFVKIGGYFLSLKSVNINEEIEEAKNSIKLLGGEIEDIIEYKLPDETPRSIIKIKKISQTPTKYPRNAGKMKKNPL